MKIFYYNLHKTNPTFLKPLSCVLCQADDSERCSISWYGYCGLPANLWSALRHRLHAPWFESTDVRGRWDLGRRIKISVPRPRFVELSYVHGYFYGVIWGLVCMFLLGFTHEETWSIFLWNSSTQISQHNHLMCKRNVIADSKNRKFCEWAILHVTPIYKFYPFFRMVKRTHKNDSFFEFFVLKVK